MTKSLDGRPRLFPAALLATLAFALAFLVEGLAILMFGDSGRFSASRAAQISVVYGMLALPVLVCGFVLAGGLTLSRSWLPGGAVAGVVSGVVLAVVPFAVGILLFRDGDDPANLRGYVEFWLRVPSAFLLGAIPYAASGVVFGWLIYRGLADASSQEAAQATLRV